MNIFILFPLLPWNLLYFYAILVIPLGVMCEEIKFLAVSWSFLMNFERKVFHGQILFISCLRLIYCVLLFFGNYEVACNKEGTCKTLWVFVNFWSRGSFQRIASVFSLCLCCLTCTYLKSSDSLVFIIMTSYLLTLCMALLPGSCSSEPCLNTAFWIVLEYVEVFPFYSMSWSMFKVGLRCF